MSVPSVRRNLKNKWLNKDSKSLSHYLQYKNIYSYSNKVISPTENDLIYRFRSDGSVFRNNRSQTFLIFIIPRTSNKPYVSTVEKQKSNAFNVLQENVILFHHFRYVKKLEMGRNHKRHKWLKNVLKTFQSFRFFFPLNHSHGHPTSKGQFRSTFQNFRFPNQCWLEVLMGLFFLIPLTRFNQPETTYIFSVFCQNENLTQCTVSNYHFHWNI